MPFDIVRNDILNMQVDAIVNIANPKPILGYGCDTDIHKKAGPEILQAKRLDLSALGRLLKMSDKSKRQSIKQAIKDDDKKRR